MPSYTVDVPSLKEGNAKVIRCLHDALLQHNRALKAMNEDKFETLLTGIIELQLDPTTMRDWQRTTRENKEVPIFEDLLDFLDMQAHDTENSVRDVEKKRPTASNPGKRTTKSYTASVDDSCVACKNDYHPLYGCKLFIALLPDKRMQLVQDSRLCTNCLKSGHTD